MDESKRKLGSYQYRNVRVWFQNLSICVAKKAFYSLQGLVCLLAITDRINCEVLSFYYHLLLCGVWGRAHFIIYFNGKYLTFFFLLILCCFCTSVFCLFMILQCFMCCFFSYFISLCGVSEFKFHWNWSLLSILMQACSRPGLTSHHYCT